MDDARHQLVERLKTANNILVTVSRNPSVDQLSALLGLTLLLNKQGKHAAAVFSGEVPPALEFLQPDQTIEKNTDSLRDFIIALDKNKADKLRYKVEDDLVRIFITPYKTSISEADFDFSQGDFNIDLVIALGVNQQEDIDEAIVAHGRILHDATVSTITLGGEGNLGSINWQVTNASSLSELVTTLAQDLDGATPDEQIATALLTGIVSETDRFSNEKTSSQTMSVSAILMAAGANQQLVASKLDNALEVEHDNKDTDHDHNDGDEHHDEESHDDDQPKDDGAIEIDHQPDTQDEEPIDLPTPTEEENSDESDEPAQPEAHESETESTEPDTQSQTVTTGGSKLVTEAPSMGGTLTANASEPLLDPVTDPMSMPSSEAPQLLDHQPQPPTPQVQDEPATPQPADPVAVDPPEPSQPADSPEPDVEVEGHTLAELEQAVESPHLDTADLGAARDEVSKALNGATDTPAPEPIQALNAQPFDVDLHSEPTPPAAPEPQLPSVPASLAPTVIDPTAPPPVPPPIPFQFGNPPTQNNQ